MDQPPDSTNSVSFPDGEIGGSLNGVVAIGYSAGGLLPCRELVAALSCETGNAYVVLPHLSRDLESVVPHILSRGTRMPVLHIQHGMILRPDHVYVLPPTSWADLRGETLQLIPRPSEKLNCCITVFFKRLAREMGSRSAGVVLSGAAVGSDGATGIERIKRVGGFTYAQDPATAQFRGMPEQAIRTGCVDFVRTPTEIGKHISWNFRAGRFLNRVVETSPQHWSESLALRPDLRAGSN